MHNNTHGVQFLMKSMKPMCSFNMLPMMMFGGSPICVAVPPIFEYMTSGSRKGSGFMFIIRDSSMVTGAISSMVVTLSRKAEHTAVSRHSDMLRITIFPLLHISMVTARYSNMPVVESIWIMIIMPNSRHSVDASIQPTTVVSEGAWETKEMRRSVTKAPMKATTARLTTSRRSRV